LPIRGKLSQQVGEESVIWLLRVLKFVCADDVFVDALVNGRDFPLFEESGFGFFDLFLGIQIEPGVHTGLIADQKHDGVAQTLKVISSTESVSIK